MACMFYRIFCLLLGASLVSSQGGVFDYNMMNCVDFARHMGGTVPERFGFFGGEEAVVGAAAAAAGAKRQSLSSILPSSVTDLFSTVTNLGNSNVANCQAAGRHAACESIDGFLEQNFPEWFFEYKVTNNLNHVVGQVTTHRYHALFEATMKAYRCFCVC